MIHRSAYRKSKYTPRTKTLIALIFSFLIFGLIMIYDATFIYSQGIYGDSSKFVFLQLGWILVGSLGFLFFYKNDYRKINFFVKPLFGFTLILLLVLAAAALFPCSSSFAFAPCINGANRWIFFNPPPLPPVPFLGVLGFQPAELAKLALILFLAFELASAKWRDKSFLVYLIATGATSFLIMMQPNLSTTVMIFVVCSIIYFVSDQSLKPILILIPVLIVVVTALMLLSPYRRSRLLTFLGSNKKENTELAEGYHVKQISIALGSGGFLGVGFGNSRQKYQYLPEVAGDSLFAIIGEELGFIGTSAVLVSFIYFLYLGLCVARDAPNLLGRLLAAGITSWIGLQFFVNVAAIARLIPFNGVPIPLISYGGSSMIFCLMGLGIFVCIKRISAT